MAIEQEGRFKRPHRKRSAIEIECENIILIALRTFEFFTPGPRTDL
jgi:hypothetical protein